MIGIIVTGHGTFASGVASALKLIAGTPEKFQAIDFKQEDSTDDIEFKIRDTVNQMKQECKEGILIFADIVGATPYNEAVEIAVKTTDANVRVVGGFSLSMLLQANMSRGYISDVDALADFTVEEGKKEIVKFVNQE